MSTARCLPFGGKERSGRNSEKVAAEAVRAGDRERAVAPPSREAACPAGVREKGSGFELAPGGPMRLCPFSSS